MRRKNLAFIALLTGGYPGLLACQRDNASSDFPWDDAAICELASAHFQEIPTLIIEDGEGHPVSYISLEEGINKMWDLATEQSAIEEAWLHGNSLQLSDQGMQSKYYWLDVGVSQAPLSLSLLPELLPCYLHWLEQRGVQAQLFDINQIHIHPLYPMIEAIRIQMSVDREETKTIDQDFLAWRGLPSPSDYSFLLELPYPAAVVTPTHLVRYWLDDSWYQQGREDLAAAGRQVRGTIHTLWNDFRRTEVRLEDYIAALAGHGFYMNHRELARLKESVEIIVDGNDLPHGFYLEPL